MNMFVGEEVESNCGYFSGYEKPKSVTEQISIICDLFPDVQWENLHQEVGNINMPTGAEGIFATPRWQKIAPTREEAIKRVFGLILRVTSYRFCNYHHSRINQKHLRHHANTEKAFQIIGNQQKDCDFLKFHGQFGILHRGRSSRCAIEMMNVSNHGCEFGLDVFSTAIMILTHQERLKHFQDLWIDCPGDEFSEKGDGSFDSVPCFRFNLNMIEFSSRFCGGVSDRYGQPSGFILK